ncbi:hypothetical protein PSTT_17001 [Puccinia striiformis]|uniref:Protein HGH1 C-terminal domain-containing protein n=1 Tax=Puccinia striiformis TaxID=27350 RepID=A0A2S4UA45_9BASI|nr:hypothetical protein PSTT_17001 [Puccinia striiformis]
MGELIEFLHDRNPEVRRLAVHGLLPYTAANHPQRSILNVTHTPTQDSTEPKLKPGSIKPAIIEDLKQLTEDQHLTAHDAFSALINLSDTPPVVEQLNDPDFLSVIFSTIINHDSILADLACMLLSNLTKVDSVVNICPDKQRESDPNLRIILIESLILLATYPTQREIMRLKKVYRIVQILHLAETSDNVRTRNVERLVNLLMRDESEHQEQQLKIGKKDDESVDVQEEEDDQLVEV